MMSIMQQYHNLYGVSGILISELSTVVDLSQLIYTTTNPYSCSFDVASYIVNELLNANSTLVINTIFDIVPGGTEEDRKDWLIDWYKDYMYAEFLYIGTMMYPNVIGNHQQASNVYGGGTNGMRNYFGHIASFFGQSYHDLLISHYTQFSQLYIDSIYLSEWHIYGSSRIGICDVQIPLACVQVRDENENGIFESNEYLIETMSEERMLFANYQGYRGNKRYEFSNHLGNVLLTISDKKIQNCTQRNINWNVEVVSATDYSPFGAPLPGRTWNAEAYRFGFNNQERDNEVAGNGNSYTAEYWQYDNRLGRRWNVDPVVKVWESPYAAFANNPIVFTDPSGLKIINGNRVKSEEATAKANSLKEQVSKLDKDKDKDQIEKLNSQIKEQESIAAHQAEMADRLDKVIAAYKKVDETGFNKMDNLKNAGGENVDIYLDMDYGFAFSDGYVGGTEFNYEKDADGRRVIAGTSQSGDKWMRPASNQFGLNTIHIRLDASVGLNPFVGGETVAHEFGHAEYQAVFTMTYYKYVKINYNQVILHGGHGAGDPTGDAAKAAETAFRNKLKKYRRNR
jgi:RHS repeat-associated protein